MKYKILLSIISIIHTFPSYSQNFSWAINAGGPYNDLGSAIAADAQGNVYVTGYFLGTVDFDPGPNVFNLSSVNPDSNQMYIEKLDASGNLIWAKQFGGTGGTWGNAITVDDSGNVYAAGYFMGTGDFDPSSGIYDLNASSSFGNAMILKLDSLGNLIWAEMINSQQETICTSIAIDDSYHVYTTGSFSGTADFDPRSGTFNISDYGNSDIFILKLDLSGNFIWAKRIGGQFPETGTSIAIDKSSNLLCTGWFSATTDFDPGTNNYFLSSDAGSFDIFILKLDSSGNFKWAKQIGGSGTDQGSSIAMDASGNSYVTGYFTSRVDFDPDTLSADTFYLTSNGNEDVFIQKSDSAGNFVWARKMGGKSGDRGLSIFVDAYSNIYSTGYFRDTVDFDPGTGIDKLISAGNNDIYIQELDSSGIFKSTLRIGNVMDEYGNAIAVDALGNILTTGNFGGTVDFNPGMGVHSLTATGNGDLYVLKLNPVPNGISNDEYNSDFIVYPNPSQDGVLISFSLRTPQKSKIEIIDVTGNRIRSFDLNLKDGSNSIYWDGKNDLNGPINAGIYFVRLVSNQKSETKKLILY